MKVSVFGTGYVGLVQASVLANTGHEVCCIDIDAQKIEKLRNGIIPIYEPGLEALVKNNIAAGRLQFTTDIPFGVAFADLYLIAVGTPPDEDGSADLVHILAVADSIGQHMNGNKIVVNKSTVPVGTADKVRANINNQLAARGVNFGFHVVSNPEFLKEGSAVKDCERPDRIIIGTDSQEAEDVMRELYEPFNRNHEKIMVMDIKSAELTKYAANCMLATKISFINEIANIAERVGADIEAVRKGIGSDARIGYHFIYPGCGYGGSCFPKDVKALVHTARKSGYEPHLLQSVEDVNNRQKHKLFAFIEHYFRPRVPERARGEKRFLADKTFALWGLSFKPNTDDMREAASCVLMEDLWAAGAAIRAYDPQAMDETQRIYGKRSDLLLTGTKEAALHGADALVIVTEWRAFQAPDFDTIKENLRYPVIFDGRNLFDPARMEKKGLEYFAIGRGKSVSNG
jgi:UDPglucose 6-dehydrogenase